MRAYALWDSVNDGLWDIDGIVVTTTNPVQIAMYWLNLEHDEPGRYEIIAGDMSE